MAMAYDIIMAERDFIRWIRDQLENDPRYPRRSDGSTHAIDDLRVTIPPGDDCAGVRWSPGKDMLVTTDMLLEGSCFLREAGPTRIGAKAMKVNLSDMAAMAGQPIAAVVSLGLPRDLRRDWIEELFRSIHHTASVYQTAIVGGDTNSWDGPLTINITVFGEPTGRGPVQRNGARPGDALMVTGSLGGSILRHQFDFKPLVDEAKLLHKLVELHAMIDLSDGLSTDLHHLCQESRCGAEVWAEAVPISSDVHQVIAAGIKTSAHANWGSSGAPPTCILNTAIDKRTPLDHALHDGEDFQLLFAVSPKDADRLEKEQPLMPFHVNLTRLGCFTTDRQVTLLIDGVHQPLHSGGYEHRLEN
jgi:thiamine-monophosphate kinase